MKKIPALIIGGLLAASSTLSAQRVLLQNTGFDGFESWLAGSNKFVGGAWVAFAQAPDAYTFESRVQPSGNGFVFNSWDDGESDLLENYLFQEYHAGPDDSAWPKVFAVGDKIVFNGKASATSTGADTSDVVVRAFIKFLGYNDLGWEFQINETHSQFFPLTETVQDFSLSATFPDEESLQVVQIGFEASTRYDAGSKTMDSAEVYFEAIEAFVEGDDVGPTTWAGYDRDANGNVNTGSWMGWLNVTHEPAVWSYTLQNWVYLPEGNVTANGGWTYIFAPAN